MARMKLAGSIDAKITKAQDIVVRVMGTIRITPIILIFLYVLNSNMFLIQSSSLVEKLIRVGVPLVIASLSVGLFSQNSEIANSD